jgi:hypothetical protein
MTRDIIDQLLIIALVFGVTFLAAELFGAFDVMIAASVAAR